MNQYPNWPEPRWIPEPNHVGLWWMSKTIEDWEFGTYYAVRRVDNGLAVYFEAKNISEANSSYRKLKEYPGAWWGPIPMRPKPTPNEIIALHRTA